jgi:L-ascorbate metabolism protein UlaG (beta-lactamase superfamily)
MENSEKKSLLFTIFMMVKRTNTWLKLEPKYPFSFLDKTIQPILKKHLTANKQILDLKIVVSLTGIFLFASCSSVLKSTKVGKQTLPLEVYVPSSHSGELKITRMVHASVLIEYKGQSVMTDPWFTETKTYPPSEKLATSVDALPNIKVITSTMDHYDHFDLEGIKNTKLRSIPVLVPFGTKQKDKAIKAGLSDVRAVESGQVVTVGEFKITAIKARSGIKPTAFDYETAWLIEAGDWKVLVVGHRIDLELLKEIGPIDIAVLPVNKLRIKPMFKKLSMSPEEASDVAEKVNAQIAIPYHYMYKSTWSWETFIVSHKGTAQAFAESFRNKGGTPIQLNAGGSVKVKGYNK